MRIKQLITSIFVLTTIAVNAEQDYCKIAYLPPDTIYYHFNDGVQMIEIDFRGTYMSVHLTGRVGTPIGMYLSNYYRYRNGRTNIILFRNRKGEIVKSYNDWRPKPTYEGFTSVAELDELEHHKRPRIAVPGCSRDKSTLGTYVVMGPIKKSEDSEANVLPVRSRYGLIDSVGNFLLEPSFTSIYVSGSMYFVDNGTNEIAFNSELIPITESSYKIMSPSAEIPGNLYVSEDGMWGMLNGAGEVVLEPIYDNFTIKDDRIFVTLGMKHGILNPAGEIILPIDLDELSPFSAIYVLKKNDKYGILNQSNVLPVNYIYDLVQIIQNEQYYLQVWRDSKWGLIDLDGVEVIPCIHQERVTPADIKPK
ncbi:MAG: hypothetical protein ACI837_003483 [Crocinitomicaceae bacterium]|jgi:hypothetical protein